MVIQAIQINGLGNHSISPMQCHLNGVYMNEVPKFLAESPSVTTHTIQLLDLFNATHPLMILHQLSSVTSYFDVYSPSIGEYENKEIPKIQLTGKEPSWDPSTEEYSECETRISDHQDQIILPATAIRGQVFELSCTHQCMMSMMSWMLIILPLHCKPRFRSA